MVRWLGCPLAWITALVLAVPAQAAPSANGSLARGTGADDIAANLVNDGDQSFPYLRIFLPGEIVPSNISVTGDGGINSGNSACMWDGGLHAIGCQLMNSGNWAPNGHVQVLFTTSPHMADNAGAELKVSHDGFTDYGPFALAGPAPAGPSRNPCTKKPTIDRPCADLSITLANLQPVYPLGAYVRFGFQVANAGDDAADPFVSVVYSLDGKREFGGTVLPPHAPGPNGYESTFDGPLLPAGGIPPQPGTTQQASPATASAGFLAGGGSDDEAGKSGEWTIDAVVTSKVTDPDLTNNAAQAKFTVVPFGDSDAVFDHKIEQGKAGKVKVETDTCAESSPPATCTGSQDATCQSIAACADNRGMECLSTCTDPGPCSSDGACGAGPCTGAACGDACKTQSCAADEPCTAATCGGGRRALARLVHRALPAALVKIARVQIAIRRSAKKKCSWLANARGKLKPGKCDKPIWLTAAGGTFKLKKGLPAGRYTLFSRATNGAGFTESTFSKADGNLVALRVR